LEEPAVGASCPKEATVSKGPETTVTYALGYSDEERQRLVEQAKPLRGFTKLMLEEAGIGEGMRVLDVGCGVGDVSLVAAAAVGSTGSVVAVDRDRRSMQLAGERAAAAGLANVEFVEADVATLDLGRRFDAVVGRLILMYLPDPVAAVRRFAAHVVPGGVVAFQEYQLDFPAGLSLLEPVPLWEQGLGWLRETFRQAGAATGMGLDLCRVFVEAGLGAPEMTMETPLATAADTRSSSVFANVLRSLLPLAERFGVASGEEMAVDTLAERVHAQIVARGAVVAWPALVSAWARILFPTKGLS
jgi:SAM-dependent methyltransferase